MVAKATEIKRRNYVTAECNKNRTSRNRRTSTTPNQSRSSRLYLQRKTANAPVSSASYPIHPGLGINPGTDYTRRIQSQNICEGSYINFHEVGALQPVPVWVRPDAEYNQAFYGSAFSNGSRHPPEVPLLQRSVEIQCPSPMVIRQSDNRHGEGQYMSTLNPLAPPFFPPSTVQQENPDLEEIRFMQDLYCPPDILKYSQPVTMGQFHIPPYVPLYDTCVTPEMPVFVMEPSITPYAPMQTPDNFYNNSIPPALYMNPGPQVVSNVTVNPYTFSDLQELVQIPTEPPQSAHVETEASADLLQNIVPETICQSIVKQFQCPLCDKHILPEVYMCRSGHSVCCKCRQEFQNCYQCGGSYDLHNIALDNITRQFSFACRFKEAGCTFNSDADTMSHHENICKFEQVTDCVEPSCRWRGSYIELPYHISEFYESNILRTKEFATNDWEFQRHLLKAHDQLFLCYINYHFAHSIFTENESHTWNTFLMHIGPKEFTQFYAVELKFSGKGVHTIQVFNVRTPVEAICRSKKCLSLSEEDYLNYKTTGTTLFVNITELRENKCS